MRSIITLIKGFYNRGNLRTLRAKKNITASFISKGVSIIISFLIVPLTLSYVGKVEYGIWMTLSSIIHWFAFFDIGLGNGLRNKLAEAFALKDANKAKIYVSSAFALISGISLMMFAVFYITAQFVSWNTILNTETIVNSVLLNVVLVVFFFFCLDFILKLVTSILRAQQRYALTYVISIITQVFGLIALFALVKTTEGSLFKLCLVYAGKSPIVTFIAGIILFTGSLKHLKPKLKFVKIKEALPMINLGFRFF
jgi:O-antigen/teichoic acid export membrane protein